jgi:hypothetical protein
MYGRNYEELPYTVLQPPVASSLLDPNILPCTFLSDSINLCPCLRVGVLNLSGPRATLSYLFADLF